MPEIQSLYAQYAQEICGVAGVINSRLQAAFSAVPRERFIGEGPWNVLTADGGYFLTASADPSELYRDTVVALIADKHVNNGQPSLHAACLDAAAPAPGDRVLHIGCGTGYYSAILSELVGGDGQIEAFDLEPELVSRATSNLAGRDNVAVSLRSGTEGALPQSDVIYVCAGASEPVAAWLAALRPGGRLMFPLTPGWGWGAMVLATRHGNRFAARVLRPAAFIPCVGAQDETEATRLAAAFEAGGWQDVRSLGRGDDPPSNCWFIGKGWWLSCEDHSL
ncbi:MAG: methyltransferase domain-containing protein [Rhodospirillaceae bacterium]|nr:methyltransferase domain-containing protein [Rhodospirillaceae bacterium]